MNSCPVTNQWKNALFFSHPSAPSAPTHDHLVEHKNTYSYPVICLLSTQSEIKYTYFLSHEQIHCRGIAPREIQLYFVNLKVASLTFCTINLHHCLNCLIYSIVLCHVQNVHNLCPKQVFSYLWNIDRPTEPTEQP
jgi:hypothetical protein